MIIFRYLSKEILATLLAATMVLLVIFITNQSVQFLQHAAAGQLPATAILQLIMLQIPLLLPYLLPLGLYLGILLTLGRMHLDSEMTVLSACGMSRAKLAGMVMLIALGVALLVTWLMGSVVPKAQGEINYITSRAAVTASVSQVIPGRFMTFGKGDQQIVFYAESVEKHTVMHNVFLAKEINDGAHDDTEKWGVVVAKTAMEKKNYHHNGNFLIFDHGYRYLGSPGDKNYQVMKFDEYGFRINTNQVPAYNSVQYYSFSQLWAASPKDLAASAELQWRIAMPISVLIFALMALPLSEVRPRLGKFTQLFPAILIYVTYADLIFLARDWIRTGKLAPEPGMFWIHGGMFLLAMLLILYHIGWHRIKAFFAGKHK